jgi:nitrogen regulatory protein PII
MVFIAGTFTASKFKKLAGLKRGERGIKTRPRPPKVTIMKKLEALISPESMPQVRNVLESRHISNFMFSNVIARSTNGAHQCVYRGHAYELEFDAEVKLETVVQDDQATETAYAILKAAGGSDVSCKPRILLAPVNQVIFQPDEASFDSEPPTTGLKQPVKKPAMASERISSPASGSRISRPAFGVLMKMLRFQTGPSPENRSSEPLSSAARIAVGQDRRPPWPLSFWLAHR